MAAASATIYAVKGQAYRVYGWINDATTGNAIDISGGGTTLAGNISKDGGSGTGTTNTPTKITNQTGAFYLDLTATEMTAYHAGVVVSASVANQMESKISVITMDLTPITGGWWTQTVIRVENLWKQMGGYFLNKNKRNKITGLITVYDTDDSVIGTMTDTDTPTDVTKGKLS